MIPPSPGPPTNDNGFLPSNKAQVFLDTTDYDGTSDGVTTFWTNADEYLGYMVLEGDNVGLFFDVLGWQHMILTLGWDGVDFLHSTIRLSLLANKAPMTIRYNRNIWNSGTSSHDTTVVDLALNAATTPVTIDTTALTSQEDSITDFEMLRAF